MLQSIAVFFSRLGKVTKVRLGPENFGVRRAWAEFETEEQAKMALQYNQQVSSYSCPSCLGMCILERFAGSRIFGDA